MDLKGFEPLTSSMPFKKYQSLTGKNTRNTRLSVTRFGRRWTPQDAVFRNLDSARTPGLHTGLARLLLLRARLFVVLIVVCWRRQHSDFVIRTMPHAMVRRGPFVAFEPGNSRTRKPLQVFSSPQRAPCRWHPFARNTNCRAA